MRVLVAAGVLVLALSGCVASTPSPTPTVSETPTPTPTPTPTAEAFPSPTVPLSCDDFLTDEAASQVTQQPVVAREPAMLLNDLSNATLAQVGVLTCAWAPVGSVDFRSTLTITVLASADSDYAAASEYFTPGPCQVDVAIYNCIGDVLVDGYWLQAYTYSRDDVPERTLESATARWTEFLDSVQATLASAGPPRAAWVAPDSGFSLAYCDGRETTEYPPRGALGSWAAERADSGRGCWTAWDGYVGLVRGSSWAVAEMARALPAAGVEMGRWQTVDVAGADLALVASGEVCMAVVSVGVDALQFSTADFTIVDGVGTCDGFFANLSTYLAEVTTAG